MIWGTSGSADDYPPASLKSEEGFVDITLSIARYDRQSSGRVRLVVRSTLDGSKVGFVIELLPGWEAQKIEDADAFFYWGNAEVSSAGKESDDFLVALARLYGLSGPKPAFSAKVPADVVGLANDPARIESEPIRMKFFFNSGGPEDRYSEVFINVDLQRKVLEFNEKDPEYRNALVQSLSR